MSTADNSSIKSVSDFLDGISREGLCLIASRHNDNIPCTSDPNTCVATFGTFNLVIPIVFENGDKWIARIPRPGRMFSNPNPTLLDRIMHSLVITTNMVRERTCIPVPAIYGWSSLDENEAGCPYMFMEFVEGMSLGDCLHELAPHKITNIIYEWALYTWELTRITFPAIGCLGINNATKLVSVQKYISAGSVEEGRDAISPFYRGPYTSVADYLFGISYLKKSAPPDEVSYDRFSFGTYLESMIPFALKPQWNKGPFCLAHDDFNVQNILVDPVSGHIKAVLDWDYACVKPLQSLIAYPESLRWDLLSPVNANFDSAQAEWSKTYRAQWAEALLFASREVVTGCPVDVGQVASFLDDSPFYASLERGLGESWRETEAMKFCNAVVHGGSSIEVLKLAGKSMRCGPWMSMYGSRADYAKPHGLEAPEYSNGPVMRQSIIGKVKFNINFRQIIRASLTPNGTCEWKTILHRKRIQKFFSRLRREQRPQDDTVGLKQGDSEKAGRHQKRTSLAGRIWTKIPWS